MNDTSFDAGGFAKACAAQLGIAITPALLPDVAALLGTMHAASAQLEYALSGPEPCDER